MEYVWPFREYSGKLSGLGLPVPPMISAVYAANDTAAGMRVGDTPRATALSR